MTRMGRMKAVLGVFLLGVLLTSCTAFSNVKATPEYTAGRNAGEAQADADASEIACGWPSEPTHLSASRKARTYADRLERQGRSEDYIHGFFYGYTEVYEKRIRTYCGN